MNVVLYSTASNGYSNTSQQNIYTADVMLYYRSRVDPDLRETGRSVVKPIPGFVPLQSICSPITLQTEC